MRGQPQILQKGETVLDTYTVEFFLGQGAFGEVYRVRHRFLGTQALKVFKAEVSGHADANTLAAEARILSTLTHPNIVRVFDANTLTRGGQKYIFITMGFVMGESLAQLLARSVVLPFAVGTAIQIEVLEALALAHGQQPPVVHRDISPDNIMLSYAEEKPVALLSDFGLAIQADLTEVFLRPAGKYLFMAPECFFQTYLPCSDVFSAAIVYYRMITGVLPWRLDGDARFGDSSMLAAGIHKARNEAVQKPSELCIGCPPEVEAVLLKALALDIEDRYRNAVEFLSALKEALAATARVASPGSPAVPEGGETDGRVPAVDRRYKVRRPGKGFDEIAGMHTLKEMLYHDVIMPLQDKELYAQYQISIPNGLLLYGPPGCGKTFIAQKFAKEIGYHYIELKPSDIASIYVHGTQEKIRETFARAEEKAPTILFIDEMDAVMPTRTDGLGHSYASEVNEFLVQMTECHKRGIFVIAATNRPERVDPAILRTGRLDKVLYLGPPDGDARRELLLHLLATRPVEAEMDVEGISRETEGYVCSDITFLVNEAAREAMRERAKIGTGHLRRVLGRVRPSVSMGQIASYQRFAESRSFS